MMTPDQVDFVKDAISLLDNCSESDTVEDLVLVIKDAQESLEQAIYIQEDEGGSYYGKSIKSADRE